MPTTQTTDKKVPYLDRSLSADKIAEAISLLTKEFLGNFYSAEDVEFFLITPKRQAVIDSFVSLKCTFNKDTNLKHYVRLKRFYHEVFDYNIDAGTSYEVFSLALNKGNVPIDAGFGKWMYAPPQLTIGEVIKKYQNFFPIEFNDVVEVDKERPLSGHFYGHWFCHRGHKNHDHEHNGISLNFYEQLGGSSFMNLGEYLLCELFYFWLTGKHWDEVGWTMLYQISKGNEVLIACSQMGQCFVSSIDKNECGTDTGLRKVYRF